MPSRLRSPRRAGLAVSALMFGSATLGILIWALAHQASAAQEDLYEYMEPEVCGACHQDQLSQWKHSLHALAHSEPIYDHYFIQASKETDGSLETFCARCHTPLGVLNGLIPFGKTLEGPEDTILSGVEGRGVSCDFCHTVNGYEELRNAAYTVDRSNTKRGPYEDSDAHGFHETAYSEFHRTPEFCAVCHVVDHPVNGIHLEMTYQEWLESGYPEEGLICQDCHMNPNLGDPPYELPGRAALMGPERDHVANHTFVGPTIVFANEPDAQELRELSLQLLRRAAEVQITDVEMAEGELLVQVDVTNKGAGHSIPSGITELRQVWLEAIVTDEDGQVVAHLGALDEQGEILPGTVVYTTIVADAQGNPTTKFWLTEEKVSDYRIPARATFHETLRVPIEEVPAGAKVTVNLRYRTVSPFGLAEVGLPWGQVEVPAILMTSDEAPLP